ncbi:MAG: hypothetical protein N3A69_14855, partial [Leptospiraceae bacterium]|nr:hypothetical protein [Leptospiraceae bacterium]
FKPILFFLLFFGFELYSLPTTMTLEEKRYYEYVKKIRSRKFADREIDRLHQSIGIMIGKIQDHVASNKVRDAARYNDHIPTDEQIFFYKDKEGKDYFLINLSQGVTREDYPAEHVYETKAYLYLSEDRKGLSKVIIQMNRVNSTGNIYVKEMRRIINPTPFSPGPPKIEGVRELDYPKYQEENITDPSVSADDNGDIYVEFYTSNDFYLDDKGNEDRFKERTPEERETRYVVWTDKTPDTKTKPGLVRKLVDDSDIMPFDLQKKVYLTYRDTLREIDSKVKAKLHLIELNARRTIYKIMEFN